MEMNNDKDEGKELTVEEKTREEDLGESIAGLSLSGEYESRGLFAGSKEFIAGSVVKSLGGSSFGNFGTSGLNALSVGTTFQPGTGVVMAPIPSVMAPVPSLLQNSAKEREGSLSGGSFLSDRNNALPEVRALNMSELMPASQEAPPTVVPSEIVLDCVHMVFNNVSQSNVDDKVKDIAPLLKPEHFPWFANYLVVKRISTQPNFHSLYLDFLEKLGDFENQNKKKGNANPLMTPRARALNKAVVNAVYHNIAKLLRSNKITTSTSERSLLKNLGSWLGQITLQKNRPILQRRLDVKELLFQGYETGRLIAICPFVAKILEGAKNSIVFRPPNPWLMGLMAVLGELYHVEDLKMNIKFEIEVLAKHLGIKLDEIPTTILSQSLAKRLTPHKERNPDFNVKRPAINISDSNNTESNTAQLSSAAPPHVPSFNSAQNRPANNFSGQQSPPSQPPILPRAAVPSFQPSPSLRDQVAAAESQRVQQAQQIPPPPVSASPNFAEQTVIPNLASYITVSASGVSANFATALRRVAPVAVDRAIREIIQPVVERSVTIACITTKELVTKDFAYEIDELRIRKAAQLMVSNLAGSLALVTCKEPLRVSIAKHLRALLSQSQQIAPNTTEGPKAHTIQICAGENLDLGTMLIEKAATEKAIRDVDEALSATLKTRKQRRDQGLEPIIEETGRYPAALPEPLRPKASGLLPQQLFVYEAFARTPRHQQTSAQPGSKTPTATTTTTTTTTTRTPGNGPVQATTVPSAAQNQQKQQRRGGAAALSAAAKQAASSQSEISIQELMEAYRGATAKLDLEFASLEAQLGKDAENVSFAQLRNHVIVVHVGEILVASARVERGSRDDAAMIIAQSTFKAMCEPRALEPPVRLETLAIVLAATAHISQSLSVREEVINWIGFLPVRTEAERYLHSHVLARLLGVDLLDVTELDGYLAMNIDGDRSQPWFEIALGVIEIAVARYRLAAFPHDFPRLANNLEVVARSPHPPPALRRLVAALSAAEQNRLKQQATTAVQQGTPRGPQPQLAQPQQPQLALPQRRTVPRDPPGAQEHVTQLLEQWIRVWNESPGSEKAYASYLALLAQHGVPRADVSTERFVRLAARACVDNAKRRLEAQQQKRRQQGNKNNDDDIDTIDYTVIDAYAKLLVLIIKYGGGTENSQAIRLALLNRVLTTLTNTLLDEYDAAHKNNEKAVCLEQRPYFRIFIDLLHDLNVPDPMLDSSNPRVICAFATCFHALQPSVLPVFAFSWLELISHRMFLPNVLLIKNQKGWIIMHRLLVDLFVFLEPYLRRIELTDAIRTLYKGTLRVLLVLLHDFPEFLSDFHHSFCDLIPSSCIQLRNLFLSAFPRSMRLPDPFTPNLKVDLLPEISQPPRVLSNCVAALDAFDLRESLDEYLRTRHPISFLLELPRKLTKIAINTKEKDVSSYEIPLVNALVVHIGTTAIAQLHAKSQAGASAGPIAHSAPMDVFQHLTNNLDAEGRYLLLNAIANQLRFPNQHTHYYSCVILFLFAESTDQFVKEQITRVLLERLIVHRPHPWGLLITFIELIKNSRYAFWSHDFTHCASEIERVFESVARSCMGPQHILSSNQDTTIGSTAAAAAPASA
uniref:CCR4-Not complex component Not1 C-terminal domain-containing protein n=1 Tax=Aureoumbra lagunensis TaxID=44058 RepID=A0A7S3NMR3_9STRA